MRWSKLKLMLSNQFADSVNGSISFNSTRYGNCTCGHAWITLNDKVIANFCTRTYWKHQADKHNCSSLSDLDFAQYKCTQHKNHMISYVDVSRQRFYRACWQFVHTLSIDQALSSDDIVIQALAVIDKRLGKKRMMRLEEKHLGHLAQTLLRHRINIETREISSPPRVS